MLIKKIRRRIDRISKRQLSWMKFLMKLRSLSRTVEFYGYLSDSDSQCLQSELVNDPMSSFCEEGSNLTITFLSFNRVSLSMRLIKSIQNYLPNYKGKILIIDNGSDPLALQQLKTYVDTLGLDIRLEELGHNYGVSGGRNKAVSIINTDWVMTLDNDIYFVGNPLLEIKNCIKKLGVSFLNLPLLSEDGDRVFSLGENLKFGQYKQGISISCDSCFQGKSKRSLKLERPFLSTFLLGGASVIKRDAFMKQGGYDENMLIGYEDVDFSLRLYKEGIKIGNICQFSLVHGHELPENKADLDYEKIRFSREIIKTSGQYFLQKHNIHAWTGDDWIVQRESELNLPPE